jgi:DNA primase
VARIPREVVEAIRDRTDIVEVIGRHVKLQKRGNTWVGLCPMHQERSPSFHVIPTKQIYHCFGCQKSGDVFTFLKEIQGLSFFEAVKELAGPAGVTLPERDLTDDERAQLQTRATLYDVLEEAARWFEAQLWTGPEGAPARAYLERRAMTQETARAWRLGWAPQGWTRLVDHLHRRSFRPELVVEAGLAKRREQGDGHYDAFRERVIVPIRDERNRVIGFGGRLLEGDGPKYINSPETPLYQKSHVLYGLEAARRAIGQNDRAILVEGYFDVLSMHQAGFPETIATCGTSLTGEHVDKLRRLTRSVVVLLDADEAGARAAERTLPLLEKAGIAALRLQLPGAKDPDELIRESGADAMRAALARATPLLAWVAERKVTQHGLTAAGKERARDEIADLLGGLTSAQASELAPLLRLDERDLQAWARAWRPRTAPREEAPAAAPSLGWQPSRDFVHLLWLLVHRHAKAAPVVAATDPAVLDDHPAVRAAITRLVGGERVASILDDQTDAGVKRTLSAVAARDDLYPEEAAAAATVEVLARVARPRLEAALQRLRQQAIDDLRDKVPEGSRAAHAALVALRARLRALDAALDGQDVATATRLLARIDTEGPEPA